MSFLAVFLALLLEQVRPLKHENPAHSLARSWAREVVRNLDAGRHSHALLVWGVCVGLPTLCVWLVYLAALYVNLLLAFAWVVLVLYLTLGFRQFSHHFTQVRDALEAGDETAAREALARWKLVQVNELPGSELVRHALEHSVISAHRHVFGVLVWFCVLSVLGLGPAGAVFYRLSEYVARHWERHAVERQGRKPQATASTLQLTPTSASVRRMARQLWHAVDYVPARLTALGLAAVGSFEDAIDCWRNYTQRLEEGGRAENDAVILAATAGAMGVRLGGDALKSAFDANASQSFQSPGLPSGASAWSQEAKITPGMEPLVSHLRSLVGLIWRYVVLWMLLLALMTAARLTA